MPTEYKLHNSSVLGSLQGEEVLLGLGSSARQGDVIVMVRWRLSVFVVDTLLAGAARLLSIHQGFVVGAALVIRAMLHNLSQASHEQQLRDLHFTV